MKLPSDEQIEIARLWLEANAGDGGEQAACQAVASWLESASEERMLRQAAKAGGVPVSQLRRRLRESKQP